MRRRLPFLAFSMALFALGAVDDAGAQASAARQSPIAQTEVFGGYSDIRANVVASGTPVNLNGASLSVAFT